MNFLQERTMPRFFVKQDQINETSIIICGEDAHHIARSLRMAVGDKLTVCDMRGNEYDCAIIDFEKDTQVKVEIQSQCHSENESPIHIRLFQALPKGDKLDTIIQKAVECGASEIIPFESERCVVRIKQDVEDRKTERRNRIAWEAAKQCGRSVLPVVSKSVGFSQMLEMASKSDVALFCYEGDGTEALGNILDEWKTDMPESVSIIIGSEGGFSISEMQRALDMGMSLTGLGKRILRTETASGFVLACIACACELH
jgi:16S rRNA (uracil1498-N3)-methyltransferase